MSKEKRFKRIHSEGFSPKIEILVDTTTGVNYMFCQSGYSGGLTPLLDKNGNVVITKNIEQIID